MTTSLRWTSADLEALPDDGKRYEIIDGELYRSKQPHWHHQHVSFRIATQLEAWNSQTRAGQVNLAPGVIFADDEDVAPDVVWISSDRLATALQPDGKLQSRLYSTGLWWHALGEHGRLHKVLSGLSCG